MGGPLDLVSAKVHFFLNLDYDTFFLGFGLKYFDLGLWALQFTIRFSLK